MLSPLQLIILQLEDRFREHDYTAGTCRRLIEAETGLDMPGYRHQLRKAVGDPEARSRFPELFGVDGRPLVNISTDEPQSTHHRKMGNLDAARLQFREPEGDQK